MGTENMDQLNVYPPLIKGLVYVSGNMAVTGGCTIEGIVVVGGGVGITTDLTLTYDASLLSNPPPGFSANASMQIVPGSWSRVVY